MPIIRRSRGGGLLNALFSGIMAIAVLALLFVTIGVVALRIGNTLPEGTDIYFITPKNPDFDINDSENAWQTNQKVSIFSSSYENGENVTTVLSQNGDNIIAPGTVSIYKFCMYNNGNVAIAYDLDFSFDLKIDGKTANAKAFPLQIRMTRTDGKYVVGSETKWVSLAAGKLGGYEGIVGASSYEQFTLELMWAFEGNDKLDTALGNTAVNVPISLEFEIGNYAEAALNPTTQGGVVVNEGLGEDYEVGGTIRWEPFLLVIAALILCGMYLVIFRL
jgi:hypothetical protein